MTHELCNYRAVLLTYGPISAFLLRYIDTLWHLLSLCTTHQTPICSNQLTRTLAPLLPSILLYTTSYSSFYFISIITKSFDTKNLQLNQLCNHWLAMAHDHASLLLLLFTYLNNKGNRVEHRSYFQRLQTNALKFFRSSAIMIVIFISKVTVSLH